MHTNLKTRSSAIYEPQFHHGDRVIVYDRRGAERGRAEYEGVIRGRSRGKEMLYGVLPDGGDRLESWVPERRLRRVEAAVS